MTFTTSDLEAMQATQEAHMMDTCDLLGRQPNGVDDFNQPLWTEVETLGVACGLDTRASRELMGETQLPVYDARVRLPIGTVVAEVDRVRVTHRFGVALATPLLYEALGLAMRGPSGLVLNLRSVTKE